MKISVICSDSFHPVNSFLDSWIASKSGQHQARLVRSKRELDGGDLLFLISCSEVINANERAAYSACLVLHASDLPLGRGWSPHIWEIIGGASEITVSLLEADDKVDSGRVWRKLSVPVPRHALWNEVNVLLFEAEIELMDYAVMHFGQVEPSQQDPAVRPTYYPRRGPADSQVDPNKSLAEQFDLIRVCDPRRFPAFFELHGHRYKLVLEKMDD